MGEHNPCPLTELIDPGWAQALAPVEGRAHELGAMSAIEVKAGHGYLPAGTDALRVFTHPLNKAKVLIIGQDPHLMPGHAMGLSFSVHPGVASPELLVNVLCELSEDMGVLAPTLGSLAPWCEQGVYLLNHALTVRPGAPVSHRGRSWEEMAQCVIDALVPRKRSDGSRAALVAILWGKDT